MATQQHLHEMDLPGELQIAIGDCGEPGNRPPGWPYPSFDSQHWAEEFAKQRPEIDQGEMIGWFANAIMAGFDHANRTSCAPDLLAALEALAPYLDAIVCYASTMDEHEPNRIAAEARAAIAKARGEVVA